MNDFKNKKLLVLAGAAVHNKVVEAAKAMGVYTIVTDYLPDSPAKKIADEAWDYSITDVESIVARCKEEKVDGVISVCIDPAQRPYQKICEELGLPCYGTKEQFFIMSDKPAFKEYCQKHGVDIVPTYTETDVAKGMVQYPLFIKPRDSRGSRGQTVCHCAAQLGEAMASAVKESSDGSVVIEKWMGANQEFSMTYFVINGEPYLVRTADRYVGKPEDGLDKQSVCSVSPSKYSQMYMQNVNEKVAGMIKALGVVNGPLFFQGFVDGDTVRIFDPGLRFPGAEYERLFCRATGADLMKMMVELALTGQVSDRFGDLTDGYLLGGARSVQLLVTARGGVIHTFDGLDEIRQDPRVVMVSPRYGVGDEVPSSGDVRQRILEVVILVEKGAYMVEAITCIQSKLVVLDEKGENMLVSQIDAREID